MARLWFSVSLLAIAVSLCRAGGAQAQAESPPVVTLRTVITGTCQEIQRYAESLVGAGVIRSASEVQGMHHDYTHFSSLQMLFLYLVIFFINLNSHVLFLMRNLIINFQLSLFSPQPSFRHPPSTC